jgi:L-fuculose-phosphate aldolase
MRENRAMMWEAVDAADDTVELREAVIQACLHLTRLRFFLGTYGNVSVRVQDGLLITPSAVCYDTMAPDDFVVVSWDGTQVLRGHRVPSSETEMHRRLMLRRPDLGAFIHTHSTYASTLSCVGRSIPACVEDMAQLIGGDVRCAPYVCGSFHDELAEGACRTIGEDSAAVLLANHGSVVGGRRLAEAVVACEVLEKAAAMTVHAAPFGGVIPMPPEMVIEERQRFLYRYGRVADGALTQRRV